MSQIIVAGDQTVDAISDAVLTASRLLVSLSARSIAAVDETITIAQFRVLVVLETRGPLNLAALAESLGVQPSTATRMVVRLVHAELTSRQVSAQSRRELTVELTERGASVVREVTQRRRAEIDAVVAKMPTSHRSELVRALAAFTTACEAKPTSVPDAPPIDLAKSTTPAAPARSPHARELTEGREEGNQSSATRGCAAPLAPSALLVKVPLVPWAMGGLSVAPVGDGVRVILGVSPAAR